MKLLLLAVLLALTVTPQERRRDPLSDPSTPETTRLPGGKNQAEEILKAEHQKALEDASQLVKLAQQLQEELQKNDRFVLSIATLKKTEEIEKLARRIRGRVRR